MGDYPLGTCPECADTVFLCQDGAVMCMTCGTHFTYCRTQAERDKHIAEWEHKVPYANEYQPYVACVPADMWRRYYDEWKAQEGGEG